VGKVSVDLPRLAKVKRTFDEHGSRTKRLELQDYMSQMKLRLQIQLDVRGLNTGFRLPPARLPVRTERGDELISVR